MSLVHKTIAATIVSGVALMGAAGTAEAATAKPVKPVTVKFDVRSLKPAAQAKGHITFNVVGKKYHTLVTGGTVNRSKTAVRVVITFYKGKKAVDTKRLLVLPGKRLLVVPEKAAATSVDIKVGKVHKTYTPKSKH